MVDQLDVRWRVSRSDLRRGLARDLRPHLLVSAVGCAWLLAPDPWPGDLLPRVALGVLGLQVVVLARTLVRLVRHRRRAEHILSLHDGAYVLVDRTGTTVYEADVVGVVDDDGRIRLDFADGQVLEAPWRAFTSAGLRQVRRELRDRLDVAGRLQHLPLRAAGTSSGGAGRGVRVAAVTLAVALALLPWVLS